MRACEPSQLTFRPFTAEDFVLVVAADGVPRAAAWGGAGMLEGRSVLTLYLPADWDWPVGGELTVNILPAARRPAFESAELPAGGLALRYEPSQSVSPPRIAEARLAFECRVVARAVVNGLGQHGHAVVAQVLSAHQRWPRGCAIT